MDAQQVKAKPPVPKAAPMTATDVRPGGCAAAILFLNRLLEEKVIMPRLRRQDFSKNLNAQMERVGHTNSVAKIVWLNKYLFECLQGEKTGELREDVVQDTPERRLENYRVALRKLKAFARARGRGDFIREIQQNIPTYGQKIRALARKFAAEKKAAARPARSPGVNALCRKFRNEAERQMEGQEPMQRLASINNVLWGLVNSQEIKNQLKSPELHLAVCETALEMLEAQIEVAKTTKREETRLEDSERAIVIRMIQNSLPAIKRRIAHLRETGELPKDGVKTLEVNPLDKS